MHDKMSSLTHVSVERKHWCSTFENRTTRQSASSVAAAALRQGRIGYRR
jgi:hypothetical protein